MHACASVWTCHSLSCSASIGRFVQQQNGTLRTELAPTRRGVSILTRHSNRVLSAVCGSKRCHCDTSCAVIEPNALLQYYHHVCGSTRPPRAVVLPSEDAHPCAQWLMVGAYCIGASVEHTIRVGMRGLCTSPGHCVSNVSGAVSLMGLQLSGVFVSSYHTMPTFRTAGALSAFVA